MQHGLLLLRLFELFNSYHQPGRWSNPLPNRTERSEQLCSEIHKDLVAFFGIRVRIPQRFAYRGVYKMESHGAATFMIRNGTMAQPSFSQKRAHPRFLFSADAEVTLRDGTSLPTQLDEISVRGCYMGALKPIPVGTELQLRIWEGKRECELEAKVIYLHSGNALGISGMGVVFGNMAAEQRLVIDTWLNELASKKPS